MLKFLVYGCVSIYTSSHLWKLTFCSANVSRSWPHCSIATAVGLQQLMPTISAHVPAPPPLARLLVRGHLSAKSPAGKFFPCIAPFPLWTALANSSIQESASLQSLSTCCLSYSNWVWCSWWRDYHSVFIQLHMQSHALQFQVKSFHTLLVTLSLFSVLCNLITCSVKLNSSSAPLSWETESIYRKELSSC